MNHLCLFLMRGNHLRILFVWIFALMGIYEVVGASKPNVVVILADDLGYGDLSCYGHPSIRTPNLDRMAAEGMRFTDFYSAAEVCTPSRAALLTGRYAVRSGMAHDRFRVLRNRSKGCLPESEITMAEALKEQGYATALIGKWHLGVWSINPAGHPRNHGFDHFFGIPHSNDMDPNPGLPAGALRRDQQDPAWWNAPLYRNEQIVQQPADQTQLTRLYTEEAQRFIREKKNGPFFLYIAQSFPHVPLFASDKFKGKSRRGPYGDVVEELDWGVGQILETLRKEGVAENTLVIFTSDNGPWLIMDQQGGSSGLLRDGKGSTWEGGVRVPAIAWWPGKIKPAQVNHSPVCMTDLFPTVLSLASGKLPVDRRIDGRDISRTLLEGSEVETKPIFFYRGTQLYAMRSGPWKMHLLSRKGYNQPEPERHEPPLLFNVKRDPSENFNLAAENKEVIARLMKQVEEHQATLSPVKNQLEEEVAAK